MNFKSVIGIRVSITNLNSKNRGVSVKMASKLEYVTMEFRKIFRKKKYKIVVERIFTSERNYSINLINYLSEHPMPHNSTWFPLIAVFRYRFAKVIIIGHKIISMI